MMKTYEAIYEDGRLEWTEDAPEPGRCRVRVTVLEDMPRRPPEEVQRVLDDTRGAWGAAASPDDVDRDVEAMRETWNRPWYGE